MLLQNATKYKSMIPSYAIFMYARATKVQKMMSKMIVFRVREEERETTTKRKKQKTWLHLVILMKSRHSIQR